MPPSWRSISRVRGAATPRRRHDDVVDAEAKFESAPAKLLNKPDRLPMCCPSFRKRWAATDHQIRGQAPSAATADRRRFRQQVDGCRAGLSADQGAYRECRRHQGHRAIHGDTESRCVDPKVFSLCGPNRSSSILVLSVPGKRPGIAFPIARSRKADWHHEDMGGRSGSGSPVRVFPAAAFDQGVRTI